MYLQEDSSNMDGSKDSANRITRNGYVMDIAAYFLLHRTLGCARPANLKEMKWSLLQFARGTHIDSKSCLILLSQSFFPHLQRIQFHFIEAWELPLEAGQ